MGERDMPARGLKGAQMQECPWTRPHAQKPTDPSGQADSLRKIGGDQLTAMQVTQVTGQVRGNGPPLVSRCTRALTPREGPLSPGLPSGVQCWRCWGEGGTWRRAALPQEAVPARPGAWVPPAPQAVGRGLTGREGHPVQVTLSWGVYLWGGGRENVLRKQIETSRTCTNLSY